MSAYIFIENITMYLLKWRHKIYATLLHLVLQ